MGKSKKKKRKHRITPAPKPSKTDYTLFLIIPIFILLGFVVYHSFSAGFYDDDEAGQYIQLKSLNKEYFFSSWGRAGFKLPYIFLKSASLNVIRIFNFSK